MVVLERQGVSGEILMEKCRKFCYTGVKMPGASCEVAAGEHGKYR